MRELQAIIVIVLVDPRRATVVSVGCWGVPKGLKGQAWMVELMDHVARLQKQMETPTVALVGAVASFLYTALAGHSYAHPPGMVNLDLARAARAHIWARAHLPPYNLAYHVIQNYPFVQPWLGISRLDPAGRPMAGAAEYFERVRL